MATTRKPQYGGGNDNIQTWLEDQPVLEVDADEDMFPSGDETESAAEEREPALLYESPSPRPRLAERPPKVPSMVDRAVGRVKQAAKKATAKPPPPRKNAAPKPRKPIEGVIAIGWGILGQMATPVSPAVARVFELQAPVAGKLLEEQVKGTMIDRLLQPLAGLSDGSETVIALLGPPVLVGVMQARPQLIPVLRPPLRAALKTWVQLAGPHVEKLRKEEADFEEKHGATLNAMMNYIMFGVQSDQPDLFEQFLQQQSAGAGPHPQQPAPQPEPGPDYSGNGANFAPGSFTVQTGGGVFVGPEPRPGGGQPG